MIIHRQIYIKKSGYKNLGSSLKLVKDHMGTHVKRPLHKKEYYAYEEEMDMIFFVNNNPTLTFIQINEMDIVAIVDR
jgi:hypothetical protein